MNVDLPDWPRPHFQPGGGDAFVFFAVYGQFSANVQVSAETYRTAGVPEGFEVRKLNREQTPHFPFSASSIGELLQPKCPARFAAIQEVPECMLIQGVAADPPNLNYLRDVIGLVQYFLDNGGVAAMDPQQLRLHDAGCWREEIFEPQPPELMHHVTLLVSDSGAVGATRLGAENGRPRSLIRGSDAVAGKPASRLWIRTRGMRKFGRPDLSVRKVPCENEAAVIAMCQRLIRQQAGGALIAEGQEILADNLPRGLICHHTGSFEDPDFNNVHVELQWPGDSPA